jgi:hypothetical protein
MEKAKPFKITDSFIAGIMADMGCDGGKTAPHWVVNTQWGSRKITPKEALWLKNGWLCSVCGKHSWSRYSVCSGCDTRFEEYDEKGRSPD